MTDDITTEDVGFASRPATDAETLAYIKRTVMRIDAQTADLPNQIQRLHSRGGSASSFEVDQAKSDLSFYRTLFWFFVGFVIVASVLNDRREVRRAV